MKTFSVVTPTYNRKNLINRVYDSLINQNFKDFEWIVIDDGSTDNTQELIEHYKKNADFNIKYIFTSNGGKVRALNTSLEYCEGFFYLVFDSDDWCDSDALLRIYSEWEKLTNEEKNDYASISCLKRYKNGICVGDEYKKINKYGSTYFDRVNLNIKGDKWECLLLSVAKKIKYPILSGDKYMAPDYVWLKIAELGYKTIFLNYALSTIEYQDDGISKNNLKTRVSNSKSTYFYYKNVSKFKALNLRYKLRMKINRERFLFHSKSKFSFFNFFNPIFYFGLILFFQDLIKLKKK